MPPQKARPPGYSTLMSFPVARCQTLTLPCSHPVIHCVSPSETALIFPLCLKVLRHFLLSILHTVMQKRKQLLKCGMVGITGRGS